MLLASACQLSSQSFSQPFRALDLEHFEGGRRWRMESAMEQEEVIQHPQCVVYLSNSPGSDN